MKRKRIDARSWSVREAAERLREMYGPGAQRVARDREDRAETELTARFYERVEVEIACLRQLDSYVDTMEEQPDG